MIDNAPTRAPIHYKSRTAFKLPENSSEEYPLIVLGLDDEAEQERPEMLRVDVLLTPQPLDLDLLVQESGRAETLRAPRSIENLAIIKRRCFWVSDKLS